MDAESMSPERFRWCLDRIGWSQRELGRRLLMHEKTARAMAMGQRYVPDELAAWLETLAAVHNKHPVPEGWRNKS